MTSSASTPAPKGRNWLEMSPAHFDTSLLPRKHRRPEAAGLFSVADAAPDPAKPAKPPGPQLEGQMDLLTMLDGSGEP